MKTSLFCLCKNHFSFIQCRPKMMLFCRIVVNLGQRIRTWIRYANICISVYLMQILVQLLWAPIVLTTKRKILTTAAAKLQTKHPVSTSISTPMYLLVFKRCLHHYPALLFPLSSWQSRINVHQNFLICSTKWKILSQVT